MKVKLHKQEMEGQSKFNGQIVYTAEHDGKLIKYWVIDSIDAVTFLLPEEY